MFCGFVFFFFYTVGGSTWMALNCRMQTLQDLSEGGRSTEPQNADLGICCDLTSLVAAFLLQKYIVKSLILK